MVALLLPLLILAQPGEDWPTFREHCRGLVRQLEEARNPLSAEDHRRIAAILESKPETPARAVRDIQDILDRLCLVQVHINPESRVKATRGDKPLVLTREAPTVVLVKVVNEAGVTRALGVEGPEVYQGERPAQGQWLKALPGNRPLTGAHTEYVLLTLTAREAGKREATLRFDVGQGSQDLGFRAEVPLLFTVRTP